MRKLLSVAAVVALLSSPGAEATLISIGLQQSGVNGGAITTVATDGGSGALAFVGSYGTFNFNTIIAQGAPALPQGSLATTSIQTSSSAAGTIAIYITETGLTSPSGPVNFTSGFVSNPFLGSVVSLVQSTFFSATNALYDGTLLASMTFGGGGSTLSNNLGTTSGTYSETVKYLITTGAGGSNVNSTITLSAAAAPSAVPEPGSAALLGLGLAAFGLSRRKRNRTINS